jgi:hypothetical protein
MAKLLLLTSVWGNTTVFNAAFTTPDKLKAYVQTHPEPQVQGYSMLEYELPMEVEVDPE